MSSRIIGSEENIKRARSATPKDKHIYINMEAVEELPDQFEAVISRVEFDSKDLKKNFTDVGNGTWMPNTEMMYRIAEAKGISGGDNSITEAVYDEVDINPMLCKPMEDEPTYRRIKVGEKVVKFSTVLEEDGSFRRSSACTQVYNVWDRCNEMWSKEEKYTKGYTVKGQYANKYQTKFDRKAHFDGEMKFAFAKAETKAYTKTIRELAGLMTGYKTADLASGFFMFARIRKSSKALQLEQAANLERISQGMSKSPAAALLFGEPEKNVTEKAPVLSVTPREEAIAEIECFLNSPYGDENFKQKMNGALNWLNSNKNAEELEPWTNIKQDLKTIREMMG